MPVKMIRMSDGLRELTAEHNVFGNTLITVVHGEQTAHYLLDPDDRAALSAALDTMGPAEDVGTVDGDA
jgi:hypothetical protein